MCGTQPKSPHEGPAIRQKPDRGCATRRVIDVRRFVVSKTKFVVWLFASVLPGSPRGDASRGQQPLRCSRQGHKDAHPTPETAREERCNPGGGRK